MKSFVLISIEDQHEREVLDNLKSMPEVKNAYLLFGEWDILAEIEMESPDQLDTFVIDKLRSDEKVKLTSSLLVAGR
ncbi:MAG TPA: Lrp/AsnC ligand binding domain-containing protein [Candidatus Nanoarchaeia archaeon]|nr:Lrp/AsnC ligand binding domain-containing protein [Candidatus Nanoarchaeia archaeon]